MATDVKIGGSEAAAACGVDPYCSRIQLWAEKTGRLSRPEAGERAYWGNVLQPILLSELSRRSDYHVVDATLATAEHREGFRIGHPDGYANLDTDPGVIECKTTSAWNRTAWEYGPPVPCQLQVAHYLSLTGYTYGIVCALLGGQEFRWYRIERDDDLIALMLAKEAEFVGLCETDTPPSPDGSESAERIIRRLYPDAAGGIVNLTAEDHERVEAYRKLRTAKGAIEKQMDQVKQELCLRLGEHPVGFYEGGKAVSWTPVESHRLDTTRLKEELPTVYAEYVKETSTRRFWVP